MRSSGMASHSMSWKETLEAVPWTSYPSPAGASPNLLVKVALARGPQLGLVVLATDLVQVYIEEVTTRVLTQRLQRAINESQDTQSQTTLGVGEKGERELRQATEQLVAAVQRGDAEVSFLREGFDSTLTIALPSIFTVRFLLDPLDRESASVLSTQLITPLLGLSASLLGLLKDEISDPSSLVAKVQDAIDGSGNSEYTQEGRACKTLFRIGGSSMLKRWVEKSKKGPKTKDPTPSAVSSRLGRSSPARPPSSSDTARQMFDSTAKGEVISWEDTQETGSTSRELSMPAVLHLASVGDEGEDEEPSTDEDRGVPPAQPLSSLPRKRPTSPSLPDPESPFNNAVLSHLLPSPLRSPAAPSAGMDDQMTEAQLAVAAKEQKRLAKEREEEEERENRRKRLAARAKSQASRGSAVKKRRVV